ncbi:hypothetical protein FOZ60_008942 [Perkinsus olseni]|uniref:Uncharacterized protein n=1 Tax=Perkinsus olseni TaxID=32597 RepID=A0A7J6PDX6_PEROL|nr:hypothetical protein FOZ60_008942 [Perkinsus olseni]
MDKGGVHLDLGGYYTCVQTKEAWAQAMMCMLSSIMCATVRLACVDHKKLWNRNIRDARDRRFGEAWQRQRFFKLYGSTSEFRPSLPRSRPTEPQSHPESALKDRPKPVDEAKPAGYDKSTAPKVASASSSASTTTSDHEGIRPYREVVFAAIDYFHDQPDVAQMKRGDKFYCQYETSDLYLGSKPGDGRQIWLPKFVVTGNLCGVRGG